MTQPFTTFAALYPEGGPPPQEPLPNCKDPAARLPAVSAEQRPVVSAWRDDALESAANLLAAGLVRTGFPELLFLADDILAMRSTKR